MSNLPLDKLDAIEARNKEVQDLLCRPEVVKDAKRYTALSKERAESVEVVRAYEEYRNLQTRLAEDREALKDPELRELAQEEIPELEEQIEELTRRIQVLLLPKDPNDERDTILELRAGAGGEEAALFTADLFRMYTRYAETRGWKMEVMSTSEASAGGLKEVIVLISGARVYSCLRFEGGVHRVQRVPATESQGRIHTSTATVAVLPEADEVDVVIREEDLEISTAAASGPGGQGVNTTNSAVQIKHVPTNIIIRCQEQRSQIQNRARTMQLLRSKLLEAEQRAQANAIRDERRGMVGTGDRSEKIRTYNFPQNRVTDHRIQLTLHSLDKVLDGEVEPLIMALRNAYQAELLKEFSEN